MKKLLCPSPAEEFLSQLSDELRSLGAQDAHDLAQEVRSHIAEALAECPEPDACVSEVLARFGDPRELASAMIAERAEGESDAGVPRAGLGMRGTAWAADLVWALWPAALLWPLLGLAAAMFASTLAPLGLLLSPALPGILLLFGASAFALGWPVVHLTACFRNRAAGTATIGTRAAALVAVRQEGSPLWASASQAAAAGIPAPVGVGRSRFAIAIALTVALVGIGWVPAVGISQSVMQRTDEQRTRLRETRLQAYQAAANGWTRDIYAAALDGKMAAYIEKGDRGFSAKPLMLKEFATSISADKVTDWRLADVDVEPPLIDPANESRATVAVPVLETTSAGERRRTLRFVVVDPQGSSYGADEKWLLAAIDSDALATNTAAPTPAEARESVNVVLGRVSDPAEAPARMTPEFAASPAGAQLLSAFSEHPTAGTLGDRREIERVAFSGNRALVFTVETWEGGVDKRPYRYVYTLRAGSPHALIERREMLRD